MRREQKRQFLKQESALFAEIGQLRLVYAHLFLKTARFEVLSAHFHQFLHIFTESL